MNPTNNPYANDPGFLAKTQAQGVGIPSANPPVSNPILSNAPVDTVNNASTLGSTRSVTIPPQPINTTSSANRAIGASQGALLGLTSAQTENAQNNYDTTKSNLTDLIGNYLGKGEAQLKAEKAGGVPQLQSAANSLNNQYLTQTAAYNAQYNDILNKQGVTREQSAQQISDLQQQHGYDLTNTAIQASIASTNYTNAENIISHQIDLKYSPMKDAIDFGMQFLSQNKDLLTSAQQKQFEAQLQVQNQTYTQGVYNDHLLSDTKVQMIKDAAANGAPSDVQQAIWSAPDIGSAAAAGGIYTANGNYQPVQTGFDPDTGLPIYSGFNSKTGKLEVKNPNDMLGPTGSEQTTITGSDGTMYQMGASTTMGAYATSTAQQVNKIKATTAKINSTVGVVNDANTAQLAINAVSPKSPITGQMVMNASQKYGVDPAAIIGVMQAETQLGTDGSKGAQMNNWGNVGNTDSAMALGNSVGMKPQEGVDAVARNLSQRMVQSQQNDPMVPEDGQNLTPQQTAANIVKNAPAFIQPAMGIIASSGAVYINQDKVPKGMEIVSTNYSSATQGLVPILTGKEVETVQGMDEAIRNLTDVVAPAWDSVSSGGTLYRLYSNISYATGSRVQDTPYYQARNAFDTNRENLAQQIKALSGSSPRLGLLATAENALPDSGRDTTKDGIAKMQKTLDLLSQGLKTYLPTSNSVKLNTINTSSSVTAPDGRQIIITD